MNEFAPIDALAVGVNVVDVLVQLPDRFVPGEKHPARDLVVQGGGPAATAACVLGSLGWRTGFVTRLGDDALSAITRAEFKRYGVVADFFIPDPDASPVTAVVHVDPRTGERTIFYMAERYHLLEPADIPVEAVRRAKLVLVDGYERNAAPTVLEAVRQAGGRSVLDVETGEPGASWRLLELATDCILPLNEARALTGEQTPERALQGLAKRTGAQLILTDGVRGSWALTEWGVLHQPAFAVAAVDTTGCGDAFHGAYGAGLLGGLELRSRLELASWVAAQVARGLGGRSHLPSRDLLRRMDGSVFSAELRAGLLSPPWNPAPFPPLDAAG
ncbi:MAG TPA: PfkB family carbohydrate kinase [Chthoniobacterales bacterium]